ncbi:hypothetical protein GCM10010492_13280 [Saccharothrix mutabilis subsp. mutabilis]|uniref:Uncharacterized protein n=1 Tax=Saccharothrix mutabilis subsp. mutabilis TaxID=66855 RepID=A0ABP3CW86_9PSEU
MKSLHMLRASLALRKVRARLPRLRGTPEPELDLTPVRARLDEMLARVTPATAWQAGRVLESYVDNHLTEWLAKVALHHETVATEVDLLAARVAEVRALYEVHHDHQSGVLDHLEGAVSHALERVSDPDSPYYQPEPRLRRRKGNR